MAPLQTPMVGSLAPDFSLACTPHGEGAETARLADYRNRWLMLVFYPRDFSLVCPTELTALSARIDEFRRRGCEILGVSTDAIETHRQWMAAPRGQGGLGGLNFPLASDPDGTACRAYGVYLELQKMALRGLFLIDANGVLQYQVVHNASVGRRTDEILRVLDALQSGGLCAENWTAGSKPLDPADAIVAGTVLAHYRFESRLGSGSFATVYRARDLTLERTVAIKVIRPEKVSSPAAVLAEARAAAALSHPNVCTIYSVDDSEGVPMIVMEHVAGRAMSELIRSGPASPRRAKLVARQIALGIAAAHAAGIVHGDLKPENILIAEDGTVKITDFGLARRETAAPATAQTITWQDVGGAGISGTPSYMAPELVEGNRATAASDVFAVGTLFYEMLTARKAIGGRTVLEVFNHLRELDAERLAREVPAPFSELIRSALLREAAARPTMTAIAEQLSGDERA